MEQKRRFFMITLLSNAAAAVGGSGEWWWSQTKQPPPSTRHREAIVAARTGTATWSGWWTEPQVRRSQGCKKRRRHSMLRFERCHRLEPPQDTARVALAVIGRKIQWEP